MKKFLIILFLFSLNLFAGMKNEDCLSCHGVEGIEGETARGKTLQLYVSPDALKGSAHEHLNCTDCHIGAKSFENVPHSDKPLELGCTVCHEDIYQEYIKKDVHGRAHKANNPMAPKCEGCHGGHDIFPLSNPQSRMSRQNQPDTCGNCHGKEEINLQADIIKRNLITRYKSSVHWQAIEMGKPGASCTDCHGHHNILRSSEPESRVSMVGILTTCMPCHPNEVKTFKEGAHARALTHGNLDVPTCTTCHGDHDMASLRIRRGDALQWSATQVCIWCHSNERMMARYGLDTTPVKSYLKDFHGLTQKGTFGAAATCADCHDAHHSLPSSHPQSRMHISNRATACGRCHGEVSQTFAMSFTHKTTMKKPGEKLEEIIRILYIILIAISVFGMVIHNFIIWLWAVRLKFIAQKTKGHLMRLTLYEIISHFVLFLSFTGLAITGFALKFPEAFWVKWLFSLGITESIRAFLHRTCAVLMVLDLLTFGIYLLLNKRGRTILKFFMPSLKDIKEFIELMKYYLTIKGERPKLGVFDYSEKFEFWALVWGAIIMAVTGFVLWFPKSLPHYIPSWVINVARVIHYYEALLATLAIIIWHGFNTIFHPEEYPMSTTWLTGWETEEEAKEKYNETALKIMERIEKQP